MSSYSRFALYHSPPPGPLADKTAAWLGWDAESASECEQPHLDGLPDDPEHLTRAPRKYGFHATLRAPFRLVGTLDESALRDAVAELAAMLAPVTLAGLQVAALGRFLALRPVGGIAALEAFAGDIVRGSNGWRAPMSDAERARRRPESLTPDQRALLDEWGYPYVFDQFRFHMTLTGPLDPAHLLQVIDALSAYLTPVLPAPYPITDICLFGERPDGRFEIVERYALTG